MKRIAFITTSYPEADGDPSGHFVQTEVLQRESEGHPVEVITGRGSAFGWPGIVARIRQRPRRVFAVLRWVQQATHELRTSEIDHAVAHWAVPCGFPIATRALSKEVTLELVSHGADIRLLLSLPKFARESIVNQLANRASQWRFVSQALLASLCEALAPATVAKVKRISLVMPSPIAMPEISARAIVDGFSSQQYAVSVGRLVKGKRVDVAIAWAANHGIPLAIVGDGPDERRLEIVAKKMGAKVAWLGKLPRDEALSWIRDARALVMASQHEGLSTVVREAEHLGTKVIDLSEQKNMSPHREDGSSKVKQVD